MFKNYILIAFRKLAREKAYVLINILSLSLGIAGFLILALYLRSELTYDTHHVNHERIYRLTAHFTIADGEGDNFAVTQGGVGPLMTKDFPQLGEHVRFRPSTQNVLTYEDNQRQWDRIYLTDPNVFDVFTHKVIYGDAKGAFDDPYSIAVSETFAKHYFGEGNPIGKKVSSGAFNYAVKVVFEDLPENSHLKYDALMPMSLMDIFTPGFSNSYANSLWNVGLFTYFFVPENFDPNTFESIHQKFYETYMAEQGKQFKSTVRFGLQPLADLHFGEKLSGDLLVGNIFYVYGFSAVALFILIVACINYVNLATARAAKRAKEVGMRKVLGASRAQLIGQFLGESLTFTVIALVFALIFIYLALTISPLGTLMGKERLLAELADPAVIAGVLGATLLVGLVSGLYPAFYLSSISPLAALTHVRRSWKTGFSMRQILVFAQLAISIGVIACTLLMIDQMRYIHEKPLGFDKDNRLIVRLRGYDVVKSFPTIRGEIKNVPNVSDVTLINFVPGAEHSINMIPVESNEGTMEPTGLHRIQVGINFFSAMGIEIVEGRGFSADIATDVREAAVVNESFVKKMGWEKPLGKRFQAGPTFARVVGVSKDFHYASLHNEMGALMMHPIQETLGPVPENQKALISTAFIVVLSGENVPQTLRNIEAIITKFDPKANFEPLFLEDRLNELYKTETNLMKLTGTFAAVCILISVMGIFGLAAFTTEQRTKEIGIRKVLGASDPQIISMLSRPLLWLVLLAAIPASYLGYRAIDAWLQRFAYHTDISAITFLLSTLAVCLVALLTVVLQSMRTTNANPVDALRYE
jgi:putative ABC transport system permease protein